MRESAAQAKVLRAPLTSASRSRPAVSNPYARVRRGTAETPSLALLKHAFNPTVIVLTLLWCALLYGQPITTPYWALAALTFLVSLQIVSDPILEPSAYRDVGALVRHRIFGEWLMVSAVLLFMAFAFKVTDTF